MTPRFFPDGSWVYVDEYGVPLNRPEPVRNDFPARTPPWLDRPFQGAPDYVANSTVTALMMTPRERILAMRPPVPQNPMPAQFGYDHTPLTVEDVLDVSNWEAQFRSWTSGRSRRPRRVDLEQQMFEGTPRAAGGMSVNPMM